MTIAVDLGRKAPKKTNKTKPRHQEEGELGKYCRFGNFCENFIFANSIKRHISDVKNSRLRQGLPISINNSDFAI